MRLRALIAVSALLLIAGCGESGDSEDETTGAEETTTEQPEPAADAEPLGPPKAKESIKEAEARIAKAVASDDCDVVNELIPTSRSQLATDIRCEYLRRLDGLEVLGSESFPGGGVIDYQFGDRVLTAILPVDTDGLYHVALYDPFNPKESVGTKPAKQFDAAADAAVEALADGDCDAYVAILHRRFGRGAAAPENQICDLVEPNQVQAVRKVDPSAEPESLGGNGSYAFYSLGTPGYNLTLVLARQTDEGVPEGVEPLPKDAAEYAYVDAYLTNRKAAQ